MYLSILKSKIHRATVTESNLEYEGSITVDEELMEAAGVLPYEKVHIANLTNGSRIETYVIKGKRGSGVICMNGGAAHYAKPGDLVIIMDYALMTREEAENLEPTVIKVDEKNKILQTASVL